MFKTIEKILALVTLDLDTLDNSSNHYTGNRHCLKEPLLRTADKNYSEE